VDSKFQYGFYTDAAMECFKQYGNVLDLPIVEDPYYEAIKYYTEGNVLDLGAGKNKVFHSIIYSKLLNGDYYSLDNDPCGKFDFTDIGNIPKSLKFNYVLANQFFEHLSIEDSLGMFERIEKLIEKNANLIITVPNTAHPNRYLSHIDHKTPFDYKSLYMLYKHIGLKVINIARYSKRHPQGIIEKTLARYINRIYRIDWCESIIMIGQKNV